MPHQEYIPFELHLTVSPLAPEQLSAFRQFCTSVDAKPLVINLSRGMHTVQPMISKVLKERVFSAILPRIAQLKEAFGAAGFNVTRTKVEMPMPEATPSIQTESSYFEWHGRIVLSNEPALRLLCEQHNAHLSRNALSTSPNARYITIRDYTTAAATRQRVTELTTALAQGGWELTKQEFEYCITDSNVDLDAGWLQPA